MIWGSIPCKGKGFFHFCKMFKLAVGPILLPVRWVILHVFKYMVRATEDRCGPW